MVKAAAAGIAAVVVVLGVVLGMAMPTPDERAEDKRVAQCNVWHHDDAVELKECIDE